MSILKDTTIKKANLENSKPTLNDGQGLYLEIQEGNKKRWYFRYTSPITKTRKKTSFGYYPSITLKDARSKRNEYLELISKGVDPIEHFRKINEEIKLKEKQNKFLIGIVVDEYYEIKKKNENLRDSTYKKAIGRINNHFYKYLPQKDKTKIDDITYEKAISLLKRIEASDKLETLSRVKGIIVEVLKFAYTQGYTKNTEVFSKLDLYKFKKQNKDEINHNPTVTAENDIKDLYKNILNYPHNLITKYLLILSIHTALRQGSIIKIKWKNINFEDKTIVIPKEDMKTKNDVILPLSDKAIDYLLELQLITGTYEYVFPSSSSRAKNPHISNNTARLALRRMGYTNEQQTAHGFRAMFKTVCKEHQEEHNLNNEFVERALVHKVGNDVENAYNRAKSINDIRKITNWWSEYLEKISRY